MSNIEIMLEMSTSNVNVKSENRMSNVNVKNLKEEEYIQQIYLFDKRKDLIFKHTHFYNSKIPDGLRFSPLHIHFLHASEAQSHHT